MKVLPVTRTCFLERLVEKEGIMEMICIVRCELAAQIAVANFWLSQVFLEESE